MSKKLLVIESCSECSSLCWQDDSIKYCGKIPGGVIENVHTIPDWCPLPDAPEAATICKDCLRSECECSDSDASPDIGAQ